MFPLLLSRVLRAMGQELGMKTKGIFLTNHNIKRDKGKTTLIEVETVAKAWFHKLGLHKSLFELKYEKIFRVIV